MYLRFGRGGLRPPAISLSIWVRFTRTGRGALWAPEVLARSRCALPREGRALPYKDRPKRSGRGALRPAPYGAGPRAPVFAREGGALPYEVTAPPPARNETHCRGTCRPDRARAAVGYAPVPGTVAPRPAAKDSDLTTGGPRGVRRGAIRVVMPIVPVVHPLPHVPEHIVQPKSVRSLFCYLMHPVAVVLEPLRVILLVVLPYPLAVQPLLPAIVRIPRDFVKRPIARLRASASRRIFPLGLCRQPPSRPRTVMARVVPCHVNDRHRLVVPPAVERPAQNIRLRRHGLPGASRKAFVRPDRDFRLPHPEAPADRDLMGRLLPVETLAVSRRAPHLESSRGNPNVSQAIFRVHLDCSRVDFDVLWLWRRLLRLPRYLRTELRPHRQGTEQDKENGKCGLAASGPHWFCGSRLFLLPRILARRSG